MCAVCDDLTAIPAYDIPHARKVLNTKDGRHNAPRTKGIDLL